MNKYHITFRTPGIFTILGIVFIVLKLVGTINWSWWYVLMPLYIPLCAFLLVLTILGIIALISIWCNIR